MFVRFHLVGDLSQSTSVYDCKLDVHRECTFYMTLAFNEQVFARAFFNRWLIALCTRFCSMRRVFAMDDWICWKTKRLRSCCSRSDYRAAHSLTMTPWFVFRESARKACWSMMSSTILNKLWKESWRHVTWANCIQSSISCPRRLVFSHFHYKFTVCRLQLSSSWLEWNLWKNNLDRHMRSGLEHVSRLMLWNRCWRRTLCSVTMSITWDCADESLKRRTILMTTAFIIGSFVFLRLALIIPLQFALRLSDAKSPIVTRSLHSLTAPDGKMCDWLISRLSSCTLLFLSFMPVSEKKFFSGEGEFSDCSGSSCSCRFADSGDELRYSVRSHGMATFLNFRNNVVAKE